MDRLDGKPVQAIERSDERPLRLMSDSELFEIARGGSPEPIDESSYLTIGGPKKP